MTSLETSSLNRLLSALAPAADLMPGAMMAHHIQVLLLVARGGSVTYKGLGDALNLSNASISRSVDALGSQPRRRQEGLGLLEKYPDPDEGRRYRVRLTRRGRAIVRQMCSAAAVQPMVG